MPRAWSPCSRCPEPTPPGVTMCPTCRRTADAKRRPNGNPYSTRGHRDFREAVLARDPICQVCMAARSTVADHHPIERVDLVAMGLDPNDAARGQGLCKRCHDRKTAATRPAGWNDQMSG